MYQTSANLFHLSGFSALVSLCLGNKRVLMDHFQLVDGEGREPPMGETGEIFVKAPFCTRDTAAAMSGRA